MKRLILFITLSINAVQGNAQTTSLDSNDTLCFTLDQANYLLKSTEKLYLCDSIIRKQNEKAKNLQKVIETQGDQLQLGESLINGQRNEIESLNKQKKALQIGLGASILGLIVFVIL
mgnify:CR=1 FL=1